MLILSLTLPHVDDPTLASLRLASARSKKTKKVVDTRASKGRKIRCVTSRAVLALPPSLPGTTDTSFPRRSYHVHEKIQNFMIPIDAGKFPCLPLPRTTLILSCLRSSRIGGWHEEQVDELFASLLGRTFPLAPNGEAEQEKKADGDQVEVGSLRIFG
jgi:protein AATF/BFR2